jgi:hypothetical protein
MLYVRLEVGIQFRRGGGESNQLANTFSFGVLDDLPVEVPGRELFVNSPPNL